ncbi:MAG TPA: DNA-processing protein DprA [Aggregatilineales bacterium]|nr:DNA-protecting protein DprA [Anaerolineales bacterium]HRE47217.1 DNA-processing protein DprA [Aggregatilineales bacterium]
MADQALERGYWVGFSRVKGIGGATFRTLLTHFGNAEAAWGAPTEALYRLGVESRALANLAVERRTFHPETFLRGLEKQGVTPLILTDETYPSLLREIPDPPFVLYVKGTLTPADRNALAIVGTRLATEYGKGMTRRIAFGVAAAGVTIISGLAHGIDGYAHHAALEAGGRTIAVLPGGVTEPIPKDHSDLAAMIAAQGALVSERPPGALITDKSFPPRARIISGLARAVLVVEAGGRTGTRHTTDAALEQGRDVFAVPGNALSPASVGTNRLIQEGAGVITSVEDVLNAFGLGTPSPSRHHQSVPVSMPSPPVPISKPPKGALTPTEKTILTYLKQGAAHVNDVALGCGLPIAEVTATLSILELMGQVDQVGVLIYGLPV